VPAEIGEETVIAADVTVSAPSIQRQYPTHEFKINNTRVIYAANGTSCLALARQNNIPLSRMFEFNEMEEMEVLSKDQLVYLQRKRKTGENVVHIVKSGETLWDIAQEEGIRMESLLEYNHLDSYMQPAAGEQLYLRAKAPVAPKLVKHAVDRSSANP
jgi:LysM repeat protein